MPLRMPVPIISIHFSHHDIDAAENDHHISDSVTEAHVFQHGEIDEARRTNAVAIRIWRAVADQIKSQLALRAFDPPVRFADRRTERRALLLSDS